MAESADAVLQIKGRKTMIYEIRTYTLRVGSLNEVEKRFGQAYESRQKYSPLAGFFHTEVGPLNQIVHIWPYEDQGERTRIRAEAAKDANWPPKIQEFILNQDVQIVHPFAFAPEWKQGRTGPIYELRQYHFKPGTLPAIQKAWEEALPGRVKLSPLNLLGAVEYGPANSFVHLWSYESMGQRADVRRKAAEVGVWPPKGGADHYLSQQNKIMMPSAFSPAQ